MKLIAEARTTREIAADLVLSEKTVERHRTNILAKLGMRDRVELVVTPSGAASSSRRGNLGRTWGFPGWTAPAT